jgi:hypothetical protein
MQGKKWNMFATFYLSDLHERFQQGRPKRGRENIKTDFFKELLCEVVDEIQLALW